MATPSKKAFKFLLGSLILVAGIALILLWWGEVKILFRGVAGIVLSLAGLLVMYSLKK